jgi:hypothetical protein
MPLLAAQLAAMEALVSSAAVEVQHALSTSAAPLAGSRADLLAVVTAQSALEAAPVVAATHSAPRLLGCLAEPLAKSPRSAASAETLAQRLLEICVQCRNVESVVLRESSPVQLLATPRELEGEPRACRIQLSNGSTLSICVPERCCRSECKTASSPVSDSLDSSGMRALVRLRLRNYSGSEDSISTY